jgi:ribonuclease P/MRP protein subunit POP1
MFVVFPFHSFPRDFPDTNAGKAFWKALAQSRVEKELKKPKAKRLPGVQMEETSFSPQWKALFTMSTENSFVVVLRGENYMKPFCFWTKQTSKEEEEEEEENGTSKGRVGSKSGKISIATPSHK